MRREIQAVNSGSATKAAFSGVSKYPGAMALTRRPFGPQSVAMPLVRLATAPLASGWTRWLSRGFGGSVGRNGLAGQCRLDRGNVDDAPRPAANHVPRYGLANVKDTGDIGLQKRFEIGGVKVFQRRATLDAGVVHQNMDRAARGLIAVDCIADGVVICDIEGQKIGGLASGGQA